MRVHGDAHVETLERLTFGGKMLGPWSAHPKKDPATGACLPLLLVLCCLDKSHGQHAWGIALPNPVICEFQQEPLVPQSAWALRVPTNCTANPMRAAVHLGKWTRLQCQVRTDPVYATIQHLCRKELFADRFAPRRGSCLGPAVEHRLEKGAHANQIGCVQHT